MKRFLIVGQSMVMMTCLLMTMLLDASGPGTTTAFNPPLAGNIQSVQFTTYNSQNNQYAFVWLNGTGHLSCAIYDTNGTQIGNQQIVQASVANSPSICYNSTDNQYVTAWSSNGPAFSLLDDTGAVISGPFSIEISSGLSLPQDVMCCYNSVDNQYCLSWSAINLSSVAMSYFAIVDHLGNVVQGETLIPAVTGQTTGIDTNVFVTYNPKNNEYLFTWAGDNINLSPSPAVFAIYDASGNVVVPATSIPQPGDFNLESSTIYSCYNNINNQYFIAWLSYSTHLSIYSGFFTVYDALGNIVVSATAISSPSFMYETPICSYNVRNNQYLLSWNALYSQALCCVVDTNGSVVFPTTSIGTLTLNDQSVVFNSFAATSDSYFITWYTAGATQSDPNIAYFNIFTNTPPTLDPVFNLIGKRFLNQFANYGEYVNVLNWQPGDSFNIASYNIYRGNSLIANVVAPTTTYQDHNQPNSPETYSVQVVNMYGDVSNLTTITF